MLLLLVLGMLTCRKTSDDGTEERLGEIKVQKMYNKMYHKN